MRVAAAQQIEQVLPQGSVSSPLYFRPDRC
jgi:hypothetical protein